MTLTVKSVPAAVSYTKNPIVFAWETDHFSEYNARMLMTVEMDFGAGYVELGILEKRPDPNHNYVFDISELLDAAINEYDMLLFTELNYATPLKIASKTIRQYRISVEELWGDPESTDEPDSADYIAVKGGLLHESYPNYNKFFDDYVNSENKFLTWLPWKMKVHPLQPITLFLYNWSTEPYMDLNIEFTCQFYDPVTNATTSAGTIKAAGVTLDYRKIIIIPAGVSDADLLSLEPGKKLMYYTVQAFDGTDAVSETLFFEVDNITRPNTKCFAYLNSLGGIDHIYTTGRVIPRSDFQFGSSETDKDIIIADEGTSYDSMKALKGQFNISESYGYTVFTGPKSYAEIDALRDFRLSPIKFEYIFGGQTPRYVPIVVDTKSFVLPKTGEFPFSMEFSYKYAFDNRVYAPHQKLLMPT